MKNKLKKDKHKTMTEQVYEKLEDLIVFCEIEPGTVLTESEISEMVFKPSAEKIEFSATTAITTGSLRPKVSFTWFRYNSAGLSAAKNASERVSLLSLGRKLANTAMINMPSMMMRLGWVTIHSKSSLGKVEGLGFIVVLQSKMHMHVFVFL